MTPLFSTLLGACIGSFLNVCLSRWRSDKTIFFPLSSQCPHCHRSILWYDNIPILSFMFLGAKCRFCRKPISWQYPLVETMTAFLFGVSSLRFHEESLVVISFVFVSFIVLLAAGDFKWKLLPHPFTNLFILCGLFFSNGLSKVSASNLYNAVGDFVLLGFVLYGTAQIVPKGLGGGDIKMGAGLAIWMGLTKTFVVLLLAFSLGSLMILPLLWLKMITRKSTIPFGPFLAVGSLLLWFWPGFVNQLGMDL